jgi:hypothetical protein
LYKFENSSFHNVERRVVIGVFSSKEKAMMIARELYFKSWEFIIRDYEVI